MILPRDSRFNRNGSVQAAIVGCNCRLHVINALFISIFRGACVGGKEETWTGIVHTLKTLWPPEISL